MERITTTPRPDWQARVEALGLVWHTADGRPYWTEDAAYALTPVDVAAIEAATAELYRLFVAAGDHVIAQDRLDELAIPKVAHDAIRAAWEGEPSALNFGRFDLGYDGAGPPKLFEFNADTPTSLVEAAVIQWDWKERVFPDAGQANDLHDALVAKWRDIAPPRNTSMLHLAYVEEPTGEDAVTVAYLADTAREAGIATAILPMAAIGWDAKGRRFVDADNHPIDALFKLYPWEWIIVEPFGAHAIDSLSRTLWIEPVWKMLWSNKAMLPILWELFPDHPNLLPAFRTPMAGDHVVKPIFAREGANVRIVEGGVETAARGGDYGREGHVYQALYRLPGAGDQRPVIGSWVVDGAFAGIGIREDGPITGNSARFVPHIVRG